MIQIGSVRKWPATAVWPHEGNSFNPWLADHLEVLDDALHAGWKFVDGQVQQAAGALFVDVVAKTTDNRTAVIEAQFGTSDHDHLGKLLTYLAVYEAGIAVWIVEEPRPEHIQAVTRLNGGSLGIDFYMVRLEVISLHGSDVKAPLLTLLAGPSAVFKTAATVKAHLGANQQALHDFWQQFLPLVGQLVPAFQGKKARPVRRLGGPTGRKGMRFSVAIRQHDAECSLIIFGGRHGDATRPLAELEARQADIESRFGSKLEWMKGARCRIRTTVAGGYLDPNAWPTLQPKLAQTMLRLVQALTPELVRLQTRSATQITAEGDTAEDDTAEDDADDEDG